VEEREGVLLALRVDVSELVAEMLGERVDE